MNIKKIRKQAEHQGMLLRYDRALIAQFDTPDEAAVWLSE